MNCIGFPKMFNANTTVIKNGYDATKECAMLLLGSEQGEMFGDPQFGVVVKKLTYNQNNFVLRDVLIDEILTKFNLFCPQIQISRGDVTIEQDGKKIIVHIKAMNKASFTTNTLDLVLLDEEE